MIRFGDAFLLAYTKLRVHRMRTGIAVGVSGILFGLIAGVIIVAQGVFSSVDNFSDVGLNNRVILQVTHYDSGPQFNEYEHQADPAFVSEVEAAYNAMVAKKAAAAKKYGIPYVASVDDPSPVAIDPQTKQKVIKQSSLGDAVVQTLVAKKRQENTTPFNINEYRKKYPSSRVIQEFKPLQPSAGTLTYMKGSKESLSAEKTPQQMYGGQDSPPMLTVLDQSLSQPFISSTKFDASKGEIPVIIPYHDAEKLLGYKKMSSSAPPQEKLERLKQVREHIGDVTAHYCYRNTASQALLSQAVAQQGEMKDGALDANYVKPALQYTLPSETSCGPVGIAKDTRTAEQKRQLSQQVAFEKEIGTYIGEPEQHLLTLRGVGISGDLGTGGMSSMADATQALFSSWLGYGTWNIPSGMLASVPSSAKPAAIFSQSSTTDDGRQQLFFGVDSYLLEFQDKTEARTAIGSLGILGGSISGDTFAQPFGSGVLVVDELRDMFTKVLLWVLVTVGGVAVIILASIIGRTVAEGRRESSIFRAIGASRLDIAGVYGTYVVLLCLRVVIFSAVLAVGLALVVEVLNWREATVGARVAYAAADTTKEFHLFNLGSPYLLWIGATIIVAGCLASIIPIMLGARRNPIKDMRNDT